MMADTIFKGALLNDEHTLRDWGAAITNSDVVGMPEPRTVLLDIPGMSGRLDLTEVLTGDVPYGNREIKLELACQTDIEKWQQTCLHIFNKYHGRRVQIIFDEDPGFFYAGRAEVSDPKRLSSAGQMVIAIDAEPFRYETEQTIVTLTGDANTVSGTIENLRMPTIPEVEVPADCQLFHGDDIYELTAGKQQVPGLVLHEGDNQVSLTGVTQATFYFRRGAL